MTLAHAALVRSLKIVMDVHTLPKRPINLLTTLSVNFFINNGRK